MGVVVDINKVKINVNPHYNGERLTGVRCLVKIK
jgi:hypothetical protein